MRGPARFATVLLGLLFSLAVWPSATEGFANVSLGDAIENVELPALSGGRDTLLSKDALANVFIFFRPHQDHSLDTLKQMAACEREFVGKKVHWAAVVSSSWPAADVREVVTASGIHMPVLIDDGDRLYGKLGVRLHPVVAVADQSFRLVAYEPFMKINYCDRIRAKIRFALHEIDAAEVVRTDNPERAVQPNDVKGAVSRRHLKMGEGYLRTQQPGKAEAEARKILESDASNAAAHVLLGDALAGQGHCDAAQAAYASAAALGASVARDPAACQRE